MFMVQFCWSWLTLWAKLIGTGRDTTNETGQVGCLEGLIDFTHLAVYKFGFHNLVV